MYEHLILTVAYAKDQWLLRFQILAEATWAIQLENTSNLDCNLFAFH